MKKYSTFLAEAGEPPEYPKKEFKYLAYKNGQCEEFATHDAASQFSKLVEKVQVNPDLFRALKNAYDEFFSSVYNTWYNELRNFFSEYNDAQFLVLYNKGYDEGHSSGYDEVFYKMDELATFYYDMSHAANGQVEERSEFDVRPGSKSMKK